ncbi:MAG TPA: hypothetical protein DCP69_04925 [Candidatus Omnitrophica bacterium]|nr:hypothetical protein [Candidatus Omnitrophota bacterium]
MPVASIVVDPPHFGRAYLNDLSYGTRQWQADEMAAWMAQRLAFFHGWVPACHQMVGEGPMWVHLQLHYVFPFQSMSYWDRWMAQQEWQLNAEEVLVCLCQSGHITPAAVAHVLEHRDWNQFNAPKAVNWVKLLLELSPDGPVFDPMMGTGSTLLAALELGRRAIGIEIKEDLCRQAVERIEAFIHDPVAA